MDFWILCKVTTPYHSISKRYIVEVKFDEEDVVGDVEYILVDPNTVGQFTGLLDKNGNKIFEGDILKKDYTDEIGYVIYNHENTCFELENENSSETLGLNNYGYNIEVIGNIYDNSDLYKEIKGELK